MNALPEFSKNPPAAEGAIADLNVKLPEDYLDFLRLSNGGEGFLSERCYAMLWRAEELDQANRDYHVPEQAPGLYVFGSNGGGEAFAFDLREQNPPIVVVPFIGMELQDALRAAATFSDFLAQGGTNLP